MNKKRLLTLMGGSNISYWQKVLKIQSTNLIAYWRMNETSGTDMIDLSSENNNGLYSAGMKINNAASPDGSVCPLFDASGYTSPYSAGLNTDFNKGEFTIAAWIKVSAVEVWTDAAVRTIFELYVDNSNKIEIFKSGTNNRISYYYAAGGTAKQVNVESLVSTDWIHVAMTVSKTSGASGEMKCYINGSQTGTTQDSLGIFAGNFLELRTKIGSYDTTPNQPWAGWICHASFWKAALTPSEVLALANPLDAGGLTHLEPLTDITAATEQHGSDTLDGLIYVVGGINGTEVNDVYAYDPVANSWAAKTDLPISVQSLVVKTVGSKLYAIGGYNTGLGLVYKDVYEYDPTTNTWTKKTDMPTAREDMGAAVVGTKIYIFGGLGSPGTPTKVLEIYDTATDTWSTGADMPDYKHLGDFGVSLNGLVYAIGATNTFVDYPTLTPVGDSYVYNPATNQWSAIADHPAPRCYAETVSFRGKLYTIGGCTTNTTTYVGTIYVYNPSTNTWLLAGALSRAARGVGAAVYNNKIYLSGGFTGSALATMGYLT